MTVQGQCPCGGVRITAPPPDYVNDCNCSLCFRLGPLWAYYRPAAVTISGATTAFVRTDIAAELTVHHCPTCGATTHWASLPPGAIDRMPVNARLFDWGSLEGVEVRRGDMRSAGG